MRKFVDFMRGEEFQSALPDEHVRLPDRQRVALPADWEQFAPVSPKPFAVDPDEVTEEPQQWLREWRDLTSR